MGIFDHIFKYSPDQPRDDHGRWSDEGVAPSAAKSLYERIAHPDGGFTYQPRFAKEPKDGFAVSIHPEHSFAADAKSFSKSDLVKYLVAHADLFKNPEYHFGGWHDPASDKIFLDVSVVKRSADEAAKLALAHDQIAYFDLAKMQSVTVNRNATSGGVAKGAQHGEEESGTGIDARLGTHESGIARAILGTAYRGEGDPGERGGIQKAPRRTLGDWLSGVLKYSPDQPRGVTVPGTNAGSFATSPGGSDDAKVVALTRGFFAKTDEGLPKDPRQPANTKEGVYEMAKAAHADMEEWLNKGKGVASKLGYTTMHQAPENVSVAEYRKPGGMLFIGSLKREERAVEKVNADYNGHWDQLKDVTRATFAVDTPAEMQRLVGALKDAGMTLAKPPNNRFANPTPEGYRDILLNVRFRNNFIGELQIHLKPMLLAKNEGHKFYEITRSLDAKYQNIKSSLWASAEDKAARWDAFKKGKAIYTAAWRSIVNGTAK